MTKQPLSARIGAAMLTVGALLLPMQVGFSGETLEGLASNPPRYVIEYLSFTPDSLVQGTTPYGGSTAGKT